MLNQLNIVTYLNQSICFTLQLNCPSSGRFQNVQIFSPSSHMSTYYITPLRKFFSFVLQFIHRLAFKKKRKKSSYSFLCRERMFGLRNSYGPCYACIVRASSHKATRAWHR